MIITYGVHVAARYIYKKNTLFDITRGDLTSDFLEKFQWFVHYPLKNAASLFFIPESTAAALVTASIFVAALALIIRSDGWKQLLPLSIAFLCIVLSYAPNLVVAEQFMTYRSTAALYSSLFVLLLLMVDGTIIDKLVLRKKYRVPFRKFLFTIGAIILIYAGIGAQRNVFTYIVEPSAREWRALSNFIDKMRNETATITFPVLVRPAAHDDWKTLSPLIVTDEFGRPSSLTPDAAREMVQLMMLEKGMDPHSPRKRDFAKIPTTDEGEAAPNAFVVDFSEILRIEKETGAAKLKSRPILLSLYETLFN